MPPKNKQHALATKVRSAAELRRFAESVVQDSATSLLDAGLSEQAAVAHLRESIPTVLRWMARFVAPLRAPRRVLSAGYDHALRRDVRRGVEVQGVLDVEEAVWAPRFGLKGMVDATVALELCDEDIGSSVGGGDHPQKPSGPHPPPPIVAPLEIKTGKPHGSHRAQVLLYLLLLEERYRGRAVDWGVLWLTGETDPTLVRRSHGELAALLAARNRLAAHLSDTQTLAPMLEDRRACGWCFAQESCAISHKARVWGRWERGGSDNWIALEEYPKQVLLIRTFPSPKHRRRWKAVMRCPLPLTRS